jgi:tRNA(Ser,Leu) C12 N-acetylase TAN1
MKVEDVRGFLETFREWRDIYADLAEAVVRVAPVTYKFGFASAAEFEAQAKAGILEFVPRLQGRRFHVRVHRHGPQATQSASATERLLGSILCDSLREAGAGGHVDFENPDAILDVETIGNEAGMALWTREDLDRYPFLKLD